MVPGKSRMCNYAIPYCISIAPEIVSGYAGC